MSDDVTEWDNPVHVERKCPLCGATRTRFVDVYSDGDEVVECSFGRQKCKGCGLGCKHWDAIDALTAENAELRKRVEEREKLCKESLDYICYDENKDCVNERECWCADTATGYGVLQCLACKLRTALTQRKEGSEA